MVQCCIGASSNPSAALGPGGIALVSPVCASGACCAVRQAGARGRDVDVRPGTRRLLRQGAEEGLREHLTLNSLSRFVPGKSTSATTQPNLSASGSQRHKYTANVSNTSLLSHSDIKLIPLFSIDRAFVSSQAGAGFFMLNGTCIMVALPENRRSCNLCVVVCTVSLRTAR